MRQLKKYFKVVNWLILISILGLLQVWLIMLARWLTNVDIEFHSLMLDGYFLFFTITILASFIIDQTLTTNKFINSTEVFLFIIYPLIVIIGCVSVHMICQFSQENLNKESIIDIHYTLYSMTLIYTITYRAWSVKTIQQ